MSPWRRPTMAGANKRVRCTTAEQFTWIISRRRDSSTFVDVAEDAEAGVVDEQVDLAALLLGEGEDLGGGFRASQVGGEDLRIDSVFRGEIRGEFLQAVDPAGSEDEVRPGSGQVLGQGPTDARAGARDERPLVVPAVAD